MSSNDYQARIRTPFAVLGMRANDQFLTGIDFLPQGTPILTPRKNSIAHLACVQLQFYLEDPRFEFDLPVKLKGSVHQLRVWEALRRIPSGAVQTYGELARPLNSAAIAVGQACGANPIPIVVPCHRVVGARGGLGGFMGSGDGDPLDIKRWLLRHEGVAI